MMVNLNFESMSFLERPPIDSNRTFPARNDIGGRKNGIYAFKIH